MKLMVVGAANKGKTSLLLNLVKRGRIKRFTEVERGVNDLPLSTVGVELGDWEYSHGGKPKITFMTWDFGGQVSSPPSCLHTPLSSHSYSNIVHAYVHVRMYI